jgi:hypothetical protein
LSPGPDTHQGNLASWTAVSLAAAIVVAGLVAWRRTSVWKAPLYGAAAGIVFGVEAATLKVVSDDLQADFSLVTALRLATWVTLALAVFGVVVQNLALRAGSQSSTQASTTIAIPIVSAVIGGTVFGEHLDVSAVSVGRHAGARRARRHSRGAPVAVGRRGDVHGPARGGDDNGVGGGSPGRRPERPSVFLDAVGTATVQNASRKGPIPATVRQRDPLGCSVPWWP